MTLIYMLGTLRISLNSKKNLEIRSYLITLRKKKSLTQAQLANLLSVPQSYVSKVELGKHRLDLLELTSYLHKLDKNVTEFLTLVKIK